MSKCGCARTGWAALSEPAFQPCKQNALFLGCFLDRGDNLRLERIQPVAVEGAGAAGTPLYRPISLCFPDTLRFHMRPDATGLSGPVYGATRLESEPVCWHCFWKIFVDQIMNVCNNWLFHVRITDGMYLVSFWPLSRVGSNNKSFFPGMSAGVSPTHDEEAKPSLSVLVAISTVSPLAMQIYLPSLAGMMVVFSATAGEIQLTMSAFFIAVAVSQLFWGPLSDQFGRRPVVITGMALFVAGSILCLLASTIEMLIAARVLQAAGGCTGLVLGRAIIRDLHGPRQAASMIGYVTMGMAVMPMIAPAMGGLLDQFYGWQGGFFLMLIFGCGVLIATIYCLPETHRTRTSAGAGQVLRSYAILFREPLYWSYALTASFSALTYFAYLGGAPFIASGLLSLSAAEMGFYFMFVAFGYIAGNYVSGRFAQRAGIYPMILAGTLIGMLSVVIIAGFAHFDALTAPSLFLPMILLGLGNGICLPSALSGAVSVRPELTGAASGLTASLQVAPGAAAGTLVAWLYADSPFAGTPWGMILIMWVGISLSFVAALSIRRHRKAEKYAAAE